MADAMVEAVRAKLTEWGVDEAFDEGALDRFIIEVIDTVHGRGF